MALRQSTVPTAAALPGSAWARALPGETVSAEQPLRAGSKDMLTTSATATFLRGVRPSSAMPGLPGATWTRE
ncbi:hypothetical protein GCM10009544_40970 [Streptomyces stramineus]|uniref:Uncharacterized protein n=1 Tax=Streptomyces stramineus TaxID=173861 RepID=A0ABN1AEQ9_9ACTN